MIGLSPAVEELEQAGLAVGALELIVILDLDHRQPAPVGVDGVTEAGELLLPGQQILAGRTPLVAGGNVGQSHAVLLSADVVPPSLSDLATPHNPVSPPQGRADRSDFLISTFSTLPTFERGRSAQISTCFGVLTLPIRFLTKARTSSASTTRPGSRLEHGGHPLPPLVVWQSDDGAVANSRVLHQGLLVLGAVDVEAPGDDHVLGPVHDEEEAVLVQVADVTGVVPAMSGCFRGRLGVLSNT